MRGDVEVLTLRGVSCFEQEDYLRALGYYRRAYNISRDPLLAAAIGRSMDELGLWGTAKSYYLRYLRSGKADAKGQARIRGRLAELNTRLEKNSARLLFRSNPTRARVYLELGGDTRESLGVTSMSLRLAPGTYTLVFEQKGYYAAKQTIELSKRERRELDVDMVPLDAAFNLDTRARKRLGILTIGASVPVVILGPTLTAISRRASRPMPALEVGGIGVGALGLAGVVTGIILVTTRASSDRARMREARAISPVVAPGWAGVHISF
ncbi:MAG: PEGA domain-containing protein [Myxococcota bacterium]